MHRFLRELMTGVVTTWNAGQKMALFMVLMSVEMINYVFWMLYIKHSSYAQQFVSIDVINSLFAWAVVAVFLILIFSYLFYRYQTHQKFTFAFQLVIMIIYSMGAAYVGYLVGEDNIMSAIAISTAGLLIVLFCDRKLAVWIVLLNLSIMFLVMYASKTGFLPPSDFYVGTRDSEFWVFSYIQLCAMKVLVILVIADNILFFLKENYEKSKFLSEHDSLTSLPNRTTVQSYLLHSLNKDQNVGLVMIDLDHFKDINDGFGHLFGDKVLIEVADFLKGHLRAEDMLGRYGGEEFLLVLPNTELEKATEFAEYLHRALGTFLIPIDDEENLNPTASFGVSATDYLQKITKYSLNDTDKQSLNVNILKPLMELADKAMYLAKTNGRNQVISAKGLSTSAFIKQNKQKAVETKTNLRIIGTSNDHTLVK